MSMLRPAILLLREGTDSSQGKNQVISNIGACMAVADVIRTTLGPRGMDKLVYDERKTTVSNDGATIMRLLDIVHPAAQTLVEVAKSQDAEVGDGTTSVVLLSAELMKEAKAFVEEGVHPQAIVRAFRQAVSLVQGFLSELAVNVEGKEDTEMRDILFKCAKTALNSKLISGRKDFFAHMAVDAVLWLEKDLDIDLIGIKKVPGGSMHDSFLVEGVAFKKTFSYAGFEQQPKSFKSPKLVLLNIELELKAENQNAEIRLKDPDQYQSIVDAEWKIIYEKLDKIVGSGAQIVLSRLAIGDLATQYFADRNMFCAGRVAEEDMRRVAKATGGIVQTSVNGLDTEVLGNCESFEERQVGSERYNIFTGCPEAKTATVVLRGGADQFIEEAGRSLHDAIMVVRRALKHSHVVPGGGAIEMALSKKLREYSRTIMGKSQLMIGSFARALEVIPRQVAENAGLDATDVLNHLRQLHAQGKSTYGVDVNSDVGICDSMDAFVWEPAVIKRNALSSACEAACLILSIDETVRNPESEQPPDKPVGRGGMQLSQQGMAGMMGRGVRQFKGRRGK